MDSTEMTHILNGMFYCQINEIGLSFVKYMQYITSDIQYLWDP